jgi:hypothetical protein
MAKAAMQETTAWETFRSRLQSEVTARGPEHMERLGWDAARIEEEQRRGLRRLLAHASARIRLST